MTESFPSHARAVIIGGGAMGCSTLYHLAKFGIADAVLLERKRLTAGTTWHSAAQVRRLRSSNNLTQLIKYSAELYAGLEGETGQSTGWSRTGSLSIATTADRFAFIKRQAALAAAFGVETEVIGAAEAGRIWPLMRTDDIVGAVFAPDDGRVNPSDLCAALAKGARARGASIFEETEVTGFDIRDGRVHGVRTSRGDVECEIVVNCAGLWGHRIAGLAGVAAPLHACEHFYLLTRPIPGIDGHLPTLGDHDNYLYIRDDVGGLLVGCFEPNAKGLPLDRLPNDFAFDLLNEDWDHFEPMMENALRRIPALETAEVRMLLNGPESFTADGAFLMGEAPEVRGFYLGCGMNSMGVASSGGAGRALAEWIVEGRPTMDLSPVDIRRFSAFQNNPNLLAERIPEELSRHYAIGYPGREFETARGVRRSPLHDALAAAGAQFGERHGWERPTWFRAPGEDGPVPLRYGKPAWHDAVASECRAAREAAALFDQGSFGKLLVEGPEATALLQRACANDVDVAPGRVVYTAMLNERAGFESDLTVMRLAEERYLMVTATGQARRDTDWLRRHTDEGARVAVTEVSGAIAVLGLMGPTAPTILQSLTDTDLGIDAFPLFTRREIAIGPVMAGAARLSYVGEAGFELYVGTEMAASLHEALLSAGAEHGLIHAGVHAMTALRIEKGYRAWGHDVTPDDTPDEAGLAFAVKTGKQTPFTGRDALLAKRQAPLARRLVHLALPDPEAWPIGDEPILKAGEIIGQITSAVHGHTLGHAVAMGYVRLNGAASGEVETWSDIEVDIAGERFTARASLRPFFDPTGARMATQ